MNIALATLALGRGKLFPAAESSGVEQEYEGPLDQVVVTAVGHWRGEGMALVEAVR
jgi:3-oxoacyl-[acyl-carrier-protein] synthase II